MSDEKEHTYIWNTLYTATTEFYAFGKTYRLKSCLSSNNEYVANIIETYLSIATLIVLRFLIQIVNYVVWQTPIQ